MHKRLTSMSYMCSVVPSQSQTGRAPLQRATRRLFSPIRNSLKFAAQITPHSYRRRRGTSTGYRLTQPPIISSSLAGNGGHYTATGESSLYSITATGFRVYVNKGGITPSIATALSWNIDWIASPN